MRHPIFIFFLIISIAGLENVFREIGSPAQLGEFLPPPPLTDERKDFLKSIDLKYGMKTFPKNYLD